MAASVLHCKRDCVNCSTAYSAGDPHYPPYRSQNGRRLSYITWSTNRWPKPDRAAITIRRKGG